jgi:hypothetical protein
MTTHAITPRYALEFEHGDIRFQVIDLPSQGRIQLWFLPANEAVWQLGHGKDVAAHTTVQQAMQLVRMFIRGDIDHAEYNRALPLDRNQF